MTVLSVNLNKVALIRNSRETVIPDVLQAARICIAAGAAGITVHPRSDMRHIRPDDVRALSALLAKDFPGVEFNIEGNPFAARETAADGQDYPGFMSLVQDVKPAQCTLVPDDPDQLTSDHGWNLEQDLDRLIPIVATLKDLNIRVSLFMDPDPAQIRLARTLGADRVELYTGPYADAWATTRREDVFNLFHAAGKVAMDEGLGLNAGHDLNLDNLGKFCEVPGLQEVSIGHAIISDALWQGLATTVKKYCELLSNA